MPVSFVPAPNNAPRSVFDHGANAPVLGPNPPIFSVQIATENPEDFPLVVPSNFAQLSPEEQALIMAKIRFSGMRLRADMPQQYRFNRQTQDLP